MFTITGSEPAQGLSRRSLYRGLLRKAADPLPFVAAITRCRLLSRFPGGLVREIVVRGETVRERVTFHASAVRFERLSGRARGWIENRIEVDPRGEFALRFTFALEVEGLEAGSDEERSFAERMESSYLQAIRSTLAEIRTEDEEND